MNAIQQIIDSISGLARRIRRLEAQETSGSTAGVDNFLDLTDTPNSYAGQSGKSARVNGAENALEFVTPITTTVATDPIWDAYGDLAVGSGANTASKLTMGSEGQFLGIEGGLVGWVTPPASGTLFLHEDDADVAGYEKLLEDPAGGAEVVDTAVCNNGSGEVAIDEYITYPTTGLGTTLIPGGAWHFVTFCKVDSNVGTTQIVIRVYKRASGGAETELFNLTTVEINHTDVAVVEQDSIQVDFVILATDRLVVKYFAKTTSVPDRTVSLYYEGTVNYSHLHTPFVLSSLFGITTLDSLIDVTISAPADNEVLAYDNVSGEWINQTAAEAGLATATHVHVMQALFTYEGNVSVVAGSLRIYNKTGSTKTISQVFLSVSAAPATTAIIVDIHKDGTTIFTNQANRPQIAAAANTGFTTTIDVAAWADGSYLTMDVDQIGTGTTGANLTVHVVYS